MAQFKDIEKFFDSINPGLLSASGRNILWSQEARLDSGWKLASPFTVPSMNSALSLKMTSFAGASGFSIIESHPPKVSS